MLNYNHITISNYSKFYTISINYYEVIDQESELDFDTEYELIDGIQEVFTGEFTNTAKCVDYLCKRFRVDNPEIYHFMKKKIKNFKNDFVFVISIADHELSIYGTIHRLITNITVPRKNISTDIGNKIPELLNHMKQAVMWSFALKDAQPGILLSCRGLGAGYVTTLLDTVGDDDDDDDINMIEAATTGSTLTNYDANSAYKWDFLMQTQVIGELLDFSNTQEEMKSKGQHPDYKYHYSKDPHYRDFHTLKKLYECRRTAVRLKNEVDRNIYSNIKPSVEIRNKIVNEFDETSQNVIPMINVNNGEGVSISGRCSPKKSNLKSSSSTPSNVDQNTRNSRFSVKIDDHVYILLI